MRKASLIGICLLGLFSTCLAQNATGQGILGQIIGEIVEYVQEIWVLVAPGGKLHPAGFIEQKGHVVVECVLIAVIVYLLRQPRSRPSDKDNAILTEKEIDELCEEWQPEPLAPKIEAPKTMQIVTDSIAARHVEISGAKYLNMASTDFLGLSTSTDIMDKCRACIEKYGVGSCGPRGFYGTVDVHLMLEEALANFMGAEEGIIYSYDMSTVSSILPAFANRKDLIVCDEAVHYPIQNGCNLSRAKVVMFKHNDMDDLERILKEVDASDKKSKKPLNRRFIVVEGIYHNRGDICPLDEIYKLKEKFKYRLVVDESLSFGLLGKQGKGALEHFNLPPNAAEIVTASMSNALASVGGFCVGEREVVDHQRLSGLGYCFSASLPPYLAVAAMGALDVLKKDGSARKRCLQNGAFLRRELREKVRGLKVVGDKTTASVSPVIHLEVGDKSRSHEECLDIITDITEHIHKHKAILMSVQKLTPLDWMQHSPAIKLVVTAAHEKSDLENVVEALGEAARKFL